MKLSPLIPALLLVFLYAVIAHYISREIVPDFGAITDIRQKKQEFFDFVYPRLKRVNATILKERQRLLVLEDKLANGKNLSASQIQSVSRMSRYYRTSFNAEDPQNSIKLLLRRVDVVPPSLGLAQSANESAWGTSRFAMDGSNYFGQWCFTKGCGLVPKARNTGSEHEVRKFNSVEESVSSYVQNLNSGPAYSEFRRIREKERERHSQMRGGALAAGLSAYSERGEAYIEEIRAMIRQNSLSRYDDRFWRESGNTPR
jgi:Bax protein